METNKLWKLKKYANRFNCCNCDPDKLNECMFGILYPYLGAPPMPLLAAYPIFKMISNRDITN